MKFIQTTLVAIAAVSSTVSAVATCEYGDRSSGLDQKAMHDCLANYNWDNWNGNICSDRGWYKGGNVFWQSPTDCYNYCADCLSEGINQNKNTASCYVYGGGASQCWMGYH